MTALPLSGSFAMVDPTHVAAVGPAAAVVFARIVWRCQEAGEWRATRRMLAGDTGLTPDTLRTALQVLRDREWVTARRTSADDATLVWSPVLPGQPDMGESPPPSRGIPHTPPLEVPISSLETGLEELPPTPADAGALFPGPAPTPPLRSVPTPSELDEEFARFWSLYPRRTGKKAARAAYGRARRTASVRQIASGLHAQLPAMRDTEVQYVPHPTTWLNQGRWEDDIAAAPDPRQGRPHVSSPDETYDPACLATLPPPRTDPFAARGGW